MKKNTILLGDCLELMNKIEDGSIDMILCDLPYGTTQCKWDTIIPFDDLWRHYERIIKPNGAIVLTGSEPFTSALIMSNAKLFKYDIIWKKTHPKGHLNAKKMPMRAHEHVLVFYNNLPVYNPQKTTGHIRARRVAIYNKANDGNSVYGAENRNTIYDSTERYPISVLEFSNGDLSKVLHPTQKPVALFEYLIRTYTNEEDTVLDNCIGSGTTAIACINTKRNYIGFEKDEDIFNKCIQRVEQHKISLAQNLF